MADAVGRDWVINPRADGLLYMSDLPSAPPTAPIPDLVSDSFESGDLLSPDINNAGFQWLTGTSNQLNSTITTEDAQSGTHSLKIAYPADSGAGHEAKQNWSMGQHEPELWIKQWIRVPTNYQNPRGGRIYGLANIWMDTLLQQDDLSTSVLLQYLDGGQGTSIVNHQYYTGGLMYGPFPGATLWQPSDAGRWGEFAFHLVSGVGGVIETHRRWQGEATWSLIDSIGADYQLGTVAGYRYGTVMGWSRNPPFLDATDFLIDDFQLSTTSLVT